VEDNPLHYKINAIQAISDSFWADIFPKGDDFSATPETPSYTERLALDRGDTKNES
jgi:hypothetical protein